MDAVKVAPPTPKWKEEPWSFKDFFSNVSLRFSGVLKQHPIVTVCTLLSGVFALFFFRHEAQAFLLLFRIYFGGLLVAILAAILLWWWLRRYSARWKAAAGAFAAIILAIVIVGGRSAHTYVAQYLRYETLANVMDRSDLLASAEERVLPLRAVHTLARDRMSRPEVPSEPHLVRFGDVSCWAMAIEPNKFIGRFMYPIDQVMCIPSTDPSPDFGGKIVNVHFTIGENLLFGRNIDTCVRRSFGVWRMLNYDVGDVAIMPDDSGKIVQVVSLIRWEGLLFPWPVFGGVQVIEQGETNFFGRLFGCGHWIPPQQIASHPFLLRQNIVPDRVARFTAESLRFQGGHNWFERFFTPMPWSREGDITIPDGPEDMNPQPFVLFFKANADDRGKLYKYFALETRDVETHGLSTSLWYPADGQGHMYVYRHAARGEHLIGVTAVKDRVMASRRNYQWGPNTVAEARPYIHLIADANGVVRPRFQYMTTLVTFTAKKDKDGEEVRLTPGGTPEVSLTDASRERVVWVDTYHPEKWDDELTTELGSLWAGK
jgi:hypothetical protein